MSLLSELENAFDPTDADMANRLAVQTLRLCGMVQRVLRDDAGGLRLGRDQRNDLGATVIEICELLGLLKHWPSAQDIDTLRVKLEDF